MKKYSKLLAVTLCASIALASTGCGGTDKLKNAITNNKTASSDKANDSSDGNVKCLDYVTLGDYSTINIKKSEIDKSTKEQITKNIKSTGDYTKVKKGKIKKGDIVNIYYVGKVNGKTFEGGTDKLKNAITNNKTASSDKANDSSDGNVKCLDYVTLGDYSTINIKKSEIDKSTKEQITKNIKSTGDYTKVKKGKIKKGDIVNIYYVGKVNGKTFEGGSLTKKTNKAGYDLEIGSNTFIDGFEDGLIGRKIGSKCKIKVTFPEQYSQNQDLAGKKAVFSVTINFKEVYPELSDKFVKKNMKDFDKDYENTAAGYTKYVRDNLLAEKAWSTFYDTCKVNDYPESKMKTMKTQLKTSITYYLQNNGYTLENYLKSQNSSMSDFNKQLETTAKTDVGKQLVYGAVAEKENITVSDKQYKEEVKTYLTNYNCKNEKELSSTFKDYYGVDAKTIITEDILYKNVKNFLIKNVKES